MSWTRPDRGDAAHENSGDALRRLADTHGGYFTTAEVLSLGFTAEAISRLMSSGDWLRVERNLFRLSQYPLGNFDEFAKWCTWFGAAAVVSHQSAAELHGLGQLEPRFIHLSTVLSPPMPTHELALHRRTVAAIDCEAMGPVRITTPLRTAFDLAASGIGQELLDEVISDGLAIGRLDAHALREACATQEVQVVQRVERALTSSR